MERILIICDNCRHEHFFEELRPTHCTSCNSLLPEKTYSVRLLDEFTELIFLTIQKFDCSFEQACEILKVIYRKMEKYTVSGNFFEPLSQPLISKNLLNDPAIWEILQPK